MRSWANRIFTVMGVALLVTAQVGPSLEAKNLIFDDDLDLVTAAGQPVVINTGPGSAILFGGSAAIAQVIGTDAQTAVRALILNNVVGENQVHNGININAGPGDPIFSIFFGPDQVNEITQSWGAINDLTATITEPEITSVPASCAGALICKVGGAFVYTPGTVAVLSMAADEIISVGGGSTVVFNPRTGIVQDFAEGSQVNSVSLITNNVSGLNQGATGLNVLNAFLNLSADIAIIGISGPPQAPFQSNAVQQYRGTPINFR